MIHTELIAPLHVLLRRHAAEVPDKPAFEDARRSLSYDKLEAETARLATYFQNSGVHPGDRVAILVPNSVEWVVSCLACVRAGAVAVPISHEATSAEIAYRLEDAACVLAITSDTREQDLDDIAGSIASLKSILTVSWSHAAVKHPSYADAIDGSNPSALDTDDIDAPAFIVYTSGTTGKAKGVVLSARSMLWVAAACWAPIVGLNRDDRILSCLPLYHSYALNFSVLSVVAVGATEYLMEKYSSSEIPRLLATGAFTVLPGVPTMFHYLLENATRTGNSALSGIRICVSAGAILAASTNRDFETRFGIPLLDGYGITETSTMVTMNWRTGTRTFGSCGLPLPGLATRIVKPVGNDDAAPGEEGELLVRGPNVMLGYFNKPEDTARALQGGWYHTGDLARYDPSGYVTITGRLREIIIRGGQNIAPAEIEEVLLGLSDVLDCAVAGVAHPHLGEVPVAFVVARPGTLPEIDVILAHCREKLSAYKVPHEIRLIEEIPRTGSGKVIRFKLVDCAPAAAAAVVPVIAPQRS